MPVMVAKAWALPKRRTALRAPPPTRAHGGPSTNPTGPARAGASGNANNKNIRSRNDDNGAVDSRPTSRQRTVLTHCCECTRQSTCSMKSTASRDGCSCLAAGRPCVSCTCLRQCRNKRRSITNSTGRLQNCFHNALSTISGATDPTSSAICPTIFTNESGSGTSLVAPTATVNPTTTVGLAVSPAATTESQPPTQQSTPQTRNGSRNQSEATQRTTQDPSGANAEDLPPAPAENPPAPPAAPAPLASNTEAGADLPGYEPTPADLLLDSIFGDHVHPNDGSQLDGGFSDDQKWQSRWRRMVQLSPTRYSVPKGKVGRRFLVILRLEFLGVRERKWNSERPLVFVATILQKTPGVRRAKDIRRRLARRMDLWDQGVHSALIDDTEDELKFRISSPRPPDDEAMARAYGLGLRLRAAAEGCG